MLTIHKQQDRQSVTIPLAEFSRLVESCREVETIELIDISNTYDDTKAQGQSKNKKTTGKRKLGQARGKIKISDDFNDPLPDDILREFYK
ncbi:MAG: hypothetical protein KAW12_28790 [Candidatus Aminicenantes bacterium]|nr:hypothetical protein [Candidatus Aminicenantes bacterium]